MKEVLNGFYIIEHDLHRLDSVLYMYFRRGYMLVSNDLFKQNGRQQHYRERAAALIINKYIRVDTVEALKIIVDYFIDHSTSLCFSGLYLLPTAFFHRQLYNTSSSLLYSWLLATANIRLQ
jgi:hypothetical protein